MTVLFVHGAGCTGEVFDAQTAAFTRSHAPNLPGHMRAGSPQSICEYADAIEQYVGERSLDDVVLAGHSMGAAIAVECALRRPQWLRAIVLIGGGARMRVAPALLEGLERGFEATARTIAGFFYADSSPARVQRSVEMMKAVGAEQTLRDFRACDAFDALDRLGEIGVPVLAITGEADKLAPAKHAAALASRVPAGKARIIPGAGHFVMVERPAETNDAIAAFLAGLP